MSELTLYQLGPSPNSIKVRLALGYQKIPCRIVDVDPMNRQQVVELSGQPLTPVLQDGERIVYDSYAILRYLDANWREGPRLFSADRPVMKEIEGWELFTRTQIGEVIGMMFGQAFAPSVDEAEVKRANQLLAERAPQVEAALEKSPFLMGDAPNAADLTCAAFVSYGLLDEEQEEGIRAVFAKHLHLPERFAKTRDWCARVLELDCARAS